MANEYLKPQKPLKDLNSENYFYPLTTSDQVFLLDTTTRLSSLIDKTYFTASRAIYYNGTKLLSSNNIFLNDSQIGINRTSLDVAYKFSVVGNSLFNGILYFANGTTYFLNNSADTTLRNITAYSSYTLNTSAATDSLAMRISTRAGTSSIGTNNYTSATVTQNDWAQIYYRTPILRTVYETAGDTSSAVTSSSYFQPYWWFRQWSVNTSNGARTSYHESYSLPATDNNRTANASYKIITTKNLTDADSRFVTLSTTQTISGLKTFNTKIHSAVSASDTDITRIPSDNEIALETGNGNGAISAWVWREQYTSSNWGIFHNNSTNILQFVGNSLQQIAINLSSGRLHCREWIEFSGNTGLYFPNSGSGTHLYPANDCTYGSFQMNGTKGGYYGITSGPNNNFLTFMSQTQHQGLYNAANSQWAFYYDKTNKRIGILSSSTDSNYPVKINASTRMSGNAYIDSNLYVAAPNAGSIWCGTNKDTAHGEHQIGVQSGGGRLYMYASAAANSNRGLYGSNNAGTSASYIYITQDNHIRTGVRIYGAVWNDYAEFRKGQMNNLKPGQVVTEIGNGEMKLANQRLQKGCKILSDTYGFAIGETDEYKLPIAVSGRVLVYCDTPKEELEPGDCLCANYTGNVIKMTQEEIIKYPDRIIATVSEFPDYEIWHAGDQTNQNGMKEEVKVNGRIWVYVR